MNNKSVDFLFPKLKAETLSGNKIIFPDSSNGKVTLILMAFKRQTQVVLDSWLEPFAKEYGESDEVQFFEIPMLSTRWKLMSPIIDGGMRSGIPEEKHGNVTTYYGNVDKYCKPLGIKDKSDGYVFLLDKAGQIRWRENGFADAEKLDKLYKKIDNLIAN